MSKRGLGDKKRRPSTLEGIPVGKIDLEQGSEEWKEWRKPRIGASEISAIVGVSKWDTAYTLWQRKLGFIEPHKDNPGMRKGRELEDMVRQSCNKLLGRSFQPTCWEHDSLPWCIASLDGYDKSSGEILEIKCPCDADHKMACQQQVPSHYWPQLQWQIFVTGLDSAYYASYRDDDIQLFEVKIDDEYIIDVLLPAAEDFYRCLDTLIPPEKTEDDFTLVTDPEWEFYASQYREAVTREKEWSARVKFNKECLISMTDDGNCRGAGVRLRRVNREGAVDWQAYHKRLCDLHPEIANELNPDEFRKEQIGYWKIDLEKEKS